MDEQTKYSEETAQQPAGQPVAPDPAPDQEPPLEHYIPRPRWQLVCAWVALVLFLIFVAMWYYGIAHKY